MGLTPPDWSGAVWYAAAGGVHGVLRVRGPNRGATHNRRPDDQ